MSSRRSVLVAGVGSLLTVGSGCLDSLDRNSDEPVLRDITLRNTDDEAHEVTLRLDHEGEEILHETYELGPEALDTPDADHLVAVESVWESSRGEFRADVSVHDGVRTQFRLDDDVRPPAPYRYEIRIEEGGDVSTWVANLETTTA